MKKTIVKQAENFIKTITLKNTETGTPVELTGVTAYSQMRKTPQSTDVIATATCAVSPSEGRIMAVYPSEQTAVIPVGVYGYDIWLVDTDGEAVPVLTGVVEIVGRYTQNFSVGGD